MTLNEEFDWSRFRFGLAVSIFSMVGLLLAPVVGFLEDRVISARRMVFAGLVVLAGELFFFSQTYNFQMYYAAVVLIAVGSTMSGWILMMKVL